MLGRYIVKYVNSVGGFSLNSRSLFSVAFWCTHAIQNILRSLSRKNVRKKKKDDPSPERFSPTSFLLRPMGSEKSFAWCASMTVEWWGGGGRELPTIEQLQFLAWCATTACGATVLADDFCCCYWCSSGRKECCEWNSFGVSTSGYRIAFLSRNLNFNSTNFPV